MKQYQIRPGQKFARFTNNGYDMTTVEEAPEREFKWYVNPVTRWLVIQFIWKPSKSITLGNEEDKKLIRNQPLTPGGFFK